MPAVDADLFLNISGLGGSIAQKTSPELPKKKKIKSGNSRSVKRKVQAEQTESEHKRKKRRLDSSSRSVTPKQTVKHANQTPTSQTPKDHSKDVGRATEMKQKKRSIADPSQERTSVPQPPKVATKSKTVNWGSDNVTSIDADGIVSSKDFDKIGLHDDLVRQLAFLGYKNCTPVQAIAIPRALKSRCDVMIRAPTGSGKTLAFLLPVLHQLFNLPQSKLTRSRGTLAAILSPTKELVLQTLKVAQNVARMKPSLVCGAVAGGENPKSEKARLRKGLTLLCATPGRLVYHLDHTGTFAIADCQVLVLDEADRLLDLGFEPQVRIIHKKLVGSKTSSDSPVQTLLASATLTPGVKKLAQFCMRKDAFWADPHGKEQTQHEDAADDNEVEFAVPSTLKQWYCVVPCKERLPALIAAVSSCTQDRGKRTADAAKDGHKAIVFFSSCASVDFHHDLFLDAPWPSRSGVSKKTPSQFRQLGDGFVTFSGDARNEFADGGDEPEDEVEEDLEQSKQDDQSKILADVRVFKLHGNLQKEERAGYVADFSRANRGVLLASDAASRGLDFPHIDWIIQYDPPQRVEEYLHRCGRTARIGRTGNALIFLQPSELGFLDVLRKRGVTNLYQTEARKLLGDLQSAGPKSLSGVRDFNMLLSGEIGHRVSSCAPLSQLARGAFLAALRAYRSFPRELREAFPAGQLHTGHFASSFALQEAPRQASLHEKRDKGLMDTSSGRGGKGGRGGRGGGGRQGGKGGGQGGSSAGRGQLGMENRQRFAQRAQARSYGGTDEFAS